MGTVSRSVTMLLNLNHEMLKRCSLIINKKRSYQYFHSANVERCDRCLNTPKRKKIYIHIYIIWENVIIFIFLWH